MTEYEQIYLLSDWFRDYPKPKRKLTYLQKLTEQYNQHQLRAKLKIYFTKHPFKRFLKRVWYLISFPWVWLFYNIRDWRSAVCILLSFIILSGTVWVWYLISFIVGRNTPFGITLFSIGTAVWVWWLSPVGSPFILFVTALAILLKTLFNKIVGGKHQ